MRQEETSTLGYYSLLGMSRRSTTLSKPYSLILYEAGGDLNAGLFQSIRDEYIGGALSKPYSLLLNEVGEDLNAGLLQSIRDE